MKPIEIKKGICSIRVNHFNRKLFDALIPLPDGTSYNSYLVKGEKYTCLIDTADPEKKDVFLDYLSKVSKIDFVVSHHAEQDHSGLLPEVLKLYPSAVVVTNAKCKDLLMTHLHIAENKFKVIQDGETLDLGGKTLEFIFTPWVHWPETFSTYLREDKILFPCDFFGSHLATDELLADSQIIYEPMKRYFAEIMMPFRSNIKNNLEKLSKYEIELICPSHGPIHKDVKFAVDCYKDWALSEPKNKALLLYVSMHGSTFVLINRLASRLQEHAVEIEKLNLEDADTGRVAMAMVDSATIVLATPTVLAGPHPKAIYGAYLASLLRPKVKFLAVMYSYGWGGKTVEFLSNILSALKAEIIGQVGVKGLPTENDLKLVDELAVSIAEKHSSLKKERVLCEKEEK
ncbi:MAG: FprA family A-type flavoprotein [Elusimicrobia bacterium]|nr:FprA family A-type flavoprotein [Elusimicrobiota bacterium]